MAIDIENKKTALEDDAGIYQKRKSEYTKEDIKALPFKEKLRYFMDYKMKITLIVILVIVVAGKLTYDLVFMKTENVLAVCSLDECAINDTELLRANLEKHIGIKKGESVYVYAYNTVSVNANMTYNTQLMSGGIDVIICSYEYFQQGSEAGVFADLSEVLPEELYEEVEPKTLSGSIGMKDDNGEITSYLDPAPYGIDITGSEKYAEVSTSEEQVVLCVVANTKNQENVAKTIEYFINNN